MSYPIAVQLFSVRQDLQANFYGTLKKIKMMGYDGVEFAGLYGHTPAEIKEMCRDIGLIPVSAHVPYKDMVANPNEVLGMYAEIGCQFVVIPYLTEEDRPGTENWQKVVENAKMLGETAKKLGMKLAYHNHDFEFRKINGKYALDELYDTVPADLLETELDLCWVNVGGENPSQYLLKYKDRCHIVHYKDFAGEKSENMYELIGIKPATETRPKNFEFRPVGFGNQNFPEIYEATKKTVAQWIVLEQDSPSMGLTPMECMEKGLNYIKTINK